MSERLNIPRSVDTTVTINGYKLQPIRLTTLLWRRASNMFLLVVIIVSPSCKHLVESTCYG
jgi:hypothetical protein